MRRLVYVQKKDLYPAFGWADMEEQIGYVRNDLPLCVQAFVAEHELYHLRDKVKWWFWREVKANLYGAYKHPWGFIVCCVMSLSPARLKMYAKRFYYGR